MLVTLRAPSGTKRAKHRRRWALTFGRIKTISELVMRIAKNCVYLLTLNMRMSIETAARTPMQNRKVHAESDFGIRISEIMIQVCEFGNNAPWSESRKTSNGWNRTRKLIIFSFLKTKQTKAHERLWNQKQSYGAEPGATANERACHGLCSEQHTPRQARSSLSLNVRQFKHEKAPDEFHR